MSKKDEVFEERACELPERIVRLEELPGMESAKRMLEVALCGAHPLVFVFNHNSGAADLVRAGKRIARQHDLLFHGLAYPACSCGMYAARTGECRCTRGMMRRTLGPLARQQSQFDLWTDACSVTPPAIGAWKAESESDIVARIVRTVKEGRSTAQAGAEAIELLNAWQSQSGVLLNAERIMDVARTIASMDGERHSIGARHVAEAVQYQPASIPWLWRLIGPTPVEARYKPLKTRKRGEPGVREDFNPETT